MIDDLLLKLKHRKLVMALFPIVGGIVIGGMMVVQPSFEKVRMLKEEKNNLVNKASVFTSIISFEKRMSDLSGVIGGAPEKADWIEELNNFAIESGLSILSMTPQEKRTVGSLLESTSVRIDAEGNYHQLAQFVSRVESMGRFVKVLSVDIGAERGKSPDLPETVPSPTTAKGARSYKLSVVVALFYAQKNML